eukprot:gnl/TRDRNA2_/TRDRNA2_133354_c0_seq1.p1 gnl/TRDRNA2_/TRDRNA2_133354_c0~~gnl/TRDRNA2_/TRDRNA2_133354_c0_seq1.p1  ORF type:complete len:776 (-),score=92.81 gnl/TRDRNA2_/TRDRNA2_133354_c0_seq1:10-2097(-)
MLVARASDRKERRCRKAPTISPDFYDTDGARDELHSTDPQRRINSAPCTPVASTPAPSTPVGRLTLMATPLHIRSRNNTTDELEPPIPPGSRRRSSSQISWHEDSLQEPNPSSRPVQGRLASPRWGNGDAGAGLKHHYVSLSEPGILPWLCCQVPGICIFSMIFAQIAAACYMEAAFYGLTALLSAYVALWTMNMSIFSAVGAWRMRRVAAVDWHAKLLAAQESNPEAAEVMHIVILPNYKEDESMLLETLENIGKSPLAQSCIHVVLGMEEREGDDAPRKAEFLVERTAHLFADIFASYHPANLPGEIAGKSSNTQWAYRAALSRYSSQLAKRDPRYVYLSVGDADTLWNPQYFDALAYEGLQLPPEEAVWAIWQPPMLLFRNLFAVPGFTRVTALGTMLFELSGLANQRLGTHFCFSSYSLTLALASHHKIAGWDTDVIAEDHHMFCKCFFGSLWESATLSKSKGDKTPSGRIRTRVRLHPIYLAAEGFLVESSEGYWQSCYVRFQQQRRHSQGVSELAYTLLQYMRLMWAVGIFGIAKRTHFEIWAIMWKMHTIHIFNSVQALSLMVAGMMSSVQAVRWLFSLPSIGALFDHSTTLVAGDMNNADLAKMMLFAALGPAPPTFMLSATTMYIVVLDVIEGRYRREPGREAECEGNVRLTCWQRFVLFMGTQRDMFFLAEPTVMLYGVVPLVSC